MHTTHSLQDLAYTDGTCYGCSPTHPSGLRIKSYWAEDGIHVIATHTPREEFVSWPGMVYGGFLAMLVDCHSNWTAMAAHYRNEGREPDSLPAVQCVTAHLGLDYLRPTPLGRELTLRAHVEGEVGRKTRVICEVLVDDQVTVRADSLFVRIDLAKPKTASEMDSV